MIRDPSDGSVREPQPVTGNPTAEKTMAGNTPVIDPTTSGLPAASAKDAERHERSREWLRDYRAKKQGTSK